jgi:topoisomerase IV subunit A
MTDPVTDILDKPLAEALGERYLSYALSTIMARSLPDVRDGLKPVHRRLLYAMSQLRLDPDTPPKKSARVVGDVIGRYHPHGDTSVYDALVRLAQDFAVRYRLIDGQGNFGNIDGDNAAAMRYTEARLTEVARALLEGIDEDTVDFRATYDGDGEEPIVLPAAFPNLLANGATGIAVGMATSIPPHNVDELCDALTHLISHPEASIEDLVRFVPGPDFPTGGLLVEPRASVLEAYRTGRGSFRLRARWSVEKLAQGTWQIVVSEIPYQVQKSRLIEKIAELLAQRKLMLLDDVRDESAEDIRLILVPKSRNVDPDVLMESLFKTTDLEVRIGLNMNVLDRNNVPQVMNLQQVLRAFLDHRLEVLERRTRHRLGKIEHRLHVLDGYLIAFLNLDEVIRIIREEDEPKQELMRVFGLTDIQAEAILNMRLRSLRKLEEFELRREHADLSAERADLLGLLADEGRRWKNIAAQIAETRKKFGKTTPLGRRRTDIADAPSAAVIPLDAMVEREPVTVLCSEKGWVRAMRGHLADTGEVKYKEGDRERFVLHAETTDKLVIFGTNGRFYTVAVDKLPRGRGFGEPLRLMIDLPNDAEVVTLFRHQPGRRLLVAASNGRGFQVEEDEVIAQTRAGKQIMAMGDDAEAKLCIPVDGDSVAVIGNNRKLLVFGLDEVPVMARGQGVRLQKYTDGSLNDLKTFRMAEGLSWKIGERTRTETDMTPWKGNRAGIGRLPPNGFPKNNRFG